MVLPAIKPTRLTCAKCGLEIGRIIDIQGEDLVQLGGLVVREIHGNCAGCGTGFYYALSEKRLERLLERVEKRRDS